MKTKSLSVPVSLNTLQNRIAVYPTEFNLLSDVNVCPVSFYEKDGRYWFCLEYSVRINSCSFVSLRNCVLSLKETSKSLGFTIQHSDALQEFVKYWEKSFKCGKGVA